MSEQASALPETVSRTELAQIFKALGLGNVTSDMTQLTDGGALTTQSLDVVTKVLTIQDGDHPMIDSVLPESKQEGAEFFEWNTKLSIGHIPNQTVTNRLINAREGTSQFKRETDRIKYYATGYGEVITVTEVPNALPDAQREDVSAVLRIKTDQSIHVWHGNETIAPRQVKGYDWWLRNKAPAANVQNFWTGRASGYSGVDANGFSNPADIPAAVRRIGVLLNNPKNGSRKLTSIMVSRDVANAIDNAQNFTNFKQVGDTANAIIPNGLIGGYSNRFGQNNLTLVESDAWIRSGIALAPNEAYPSLGQTFPTTFTPSGVTPAAAATAGAEVSHFVTIGGGPNFAGTYRYAVVAVDEFGAPQQAVIATQAVTAGQKVTLTIANNGATGYMIYRGAPGGANDLKAMRLIAEIAASTVANTVFTDFNNILPGSNPMYGWDKTAPGGFMERRHTMQYRSLILPLDRTQVAVKPFAAFTTSALVCPYYNGLSGIDNFIPRDGGFSPILGPV